MSNQKRKGQKQKTAFQQSATYEDDDPLWNETPELGPEGLIGTIDDKEELIAKLKEAVKKIAYL